MEQFCDSFEEAEKVFSEVLKRHQYRQYRLVNKY